MEYCAKIPFVFRMILHHFKLQKTEVTIYGEMFSMRRV